jgi:hypothetical protein
MEYRPRSAVRAQITNDQYDLRLAIEKGTLALINDSTASINEVVRDTIDVLLNPENLRKVGLEIAPTGQIVAPEMNTAILLSKSQVSALRSFAKGEVSDQPRRDSIKHGT